jgi:hypothetical protein
MVPFLINLNNMKARVHNFNTAEQQYIARQLLNDDDQGDFETYFLLIEELLRRANTHVNPLQPQLTYNDVLNVTNNLRADPTRTHQKIQCDVTTSMPYRPLSAISDLIAIAVQARVMVDSRAADWHATGFFLGTYTPVSWSPMGTFSDYIKGRLPVEGVGGHSDRVTSTLQNISQLSARNLKKTLGITFKSTDNLAQHLVLDPQHNVLYLFDQTPVLKVHLSRVLRPGAGADMTDCLR